MILHGAELCERLAAFGLLSPLRLHLEQVDQPPKSAQHLLLARALGAGSWKRGLLLL